MLRNIIVFSAFLFVASIESRAYYVDSAPVYLASEPAFNNVEQSSRDLDLSFSTGNPEENYSRNSVRPVFKTVREFDAEKFETPRAAYRVYEIPEKRLGWTETFRAPERNRKLVKLNNGHKGEVILELRVIANNNDDD